jgi:hypothetical protein
MQGVKRGVNKAYLLSRRHQSDRYIGKTALFQVAPENFSHIEQCSAHLLWITMCATPAAAHKYLDFIAFFLHAQKNGRIKPSLSSLNIEMASRSIFGAVEPA